MEWDLIFWLFASFAMLYFTDFASHILFNPVVKRYCLNYIVFPCCVMGGGGLVQGVADGRGVGDCGVCLLPDVCQ